MSTIDDGFIAVVPRKPHANSKSILWGFSSEWDWISKNKKKPSLIYAKKFKSMRALTEWLTGQDWCHGYCPEGNIIFVNNGKKFTAPESYRNRLLNDSSLPNTLRTEFIQYQQLHESKKQKALKHEPIVKTIDIEYPLSVLSQEDEQ